MPPTDYLRACFEYDQSTGELRWKQRPPEHFKTVDACKTWNAGNAGMRAGKTRPIRYHCVTIDRVLWLSHRVIWKMVTGEDPPSDIDHKDRNGLNNRWDNLRTATRTQAVWNRQLPRKVNPYRGAYRRRNKWYSTIMVGSVAHYLGTFSTPEEAAAAYETAARNLHGLFYSKSMSTILERSVDR